MDELVKCPKCEGTGWIRLPHPKTPETSRIGGNITKFLDTIGYKEKPKPDFTTCPNCNGLGLVRG